MSRSRPGKMAFEFSMLLVRKGAMIKQLTKEQKATLTREEVEALARITKIIQSAAEQLQGGQIMIIGTIIIFISFTPLVYLFGRAVGYHMGLKHGAARGWNQATLSVLQLQSAKLQSTRQTLATRLVS